MPIYWHIKQIKLLYIVTKSIYVYHADNKDYIQANMHMTIYDTEFDFMFVRPMKSGSTHKLTHVHWAQDNLINLVFLQAYS